jgi:ketosteroid isomerase-like protein
MKRLTLATTAATIALCACVPRGQVSTADLTRQVFAAESSFAASFARRDTAGFAAFVSPEAVFFGQKTVMRGKAAVVDGWRSMLVEPAPPFSWKPEVVEVLPSGTLALTSGPVHDSSERHVGDFNSIWRLEPDGAWRVIFDKGSPICDCERAPKRGT